MGCSSMAWICHAVLIKAPDSTVPAATEATAESEHSCRCKVSLSRAVRVVVVADAWNVTWAQQQQFGVWMHLRYRSFPSGPASGQYGHGSFQCYVLASKDSSHRKTASPPDV